MLQATQAFLAVFHWVLYFRVLLAFRLVRLRGCGPAQDRWLRLSGTLAVLVAVLSSLVGTVNRHPQVTTLRGGGTSERSAREPPKISVRLRALLVEMTFPELWQKVNARRTVSVIHGSPQPRQMHIEELVALYNDLQARLRRIEVRDENGRPTPLSDILDLWDERAKFLSILARREDKPDELALTVVPPGKALLRFKDSTLPPIETELNRAMTLSQFDRMLRKQGFTIMDDKGTRTITLEALKDLRAGFDIFFAVKGVYRKLTGDLLEFFYHEFPQVWAYGGWHLATPKFLKHLARVSADPGGAHPPPDLPPRPLGTSVSSSFSDDVPRVPKTSPGLQFPSPPFLHWPGCPNAGESDEIPGGEMSGSGCSQVDQSRTRDGAGKSDQPR